MKAACSAIPNVMTVPKIKTHYTKIKTKKNAERILDELTEKIKHGGECVCVWA